MKTTQKPHKPQKLKLQNRLCMSWLHDQLTMMNLLSYIAYDEFYQWRRMNEKAAQHALEQFTADIFYPQPIFM